MDTHCVDGAVWDAEGEIDIVPDARYVTGPADDGCGVGARQGPGDTSRGFWPEEELCGLFITEIKSCRYGDH